MNFISFTRRLWPYAAALGVVAVLLTTVPAQAGNIWAIKTALSPSTGLPITGGGSWIVNKPSGYYLGRAAVGSRFDVVETTGANWHYGRAITTVNMCGWVMPGSMDYQVGSQADSCSATTKDMLSHRQNIGRDYNAPAHQAGDGSAVATSGSCPLYYNYFYGTSFAGGANGGHWANYAGTASTTVYYRFTTLDRGAAVVRDPVLGWGFTVAGCTGRPAAVYNDGD
ncbi:hypothetical protein [Catellatospora tritici]|uniref:hypothetical protein n=1 Tax=Catellatospora tritici TaxID=2851566 RepID=UPI001C2D00FB|nr:hypothetical protein [Catellatospora tritici]MBV1851346.1 hypothetical protein [Catellatospora tritici]